MLTQSGTWHELCTVLMDATCWGCSHQFCPCNQSALLSGSRVLLWGPAAVEHHKTCRSLGKSLWQQPSVGDILRLLDPDRMMQTILHFPQYRRLLPTEV